MLHARELSQQQLLDIVTTIQVTLYLDEDSECGECWNREKANTGADLIQDLDLIFASYGLVPKAVDIDGWSARSELAKRR